MKKILTVLLVLSSVYGWSQNENMITAADKMNRTLFLLEKYYVDTISYPVLGEASLKAMLEQLDPHSAYIPAKDLESVNEEMDGEFEGIGIQFNMIGDTLTVQAVIAGGPCASAGMMAGDKIVMVDSVGIASVGMSNVAIQKMLRGPKGSKVALTVVRRGLDGPLSFFITRDKIPLESIDAAYNVEPGIIYLKISRFAAKTANEFYDAIASVASRRPQGFILDLRGNGGGLVAPAIRICDFFLSEGENIFYTEGVRHPRQDVCATGTGLFKSGPLVVMIDENSASASEIVAGAIQDWDRGVIVGRRSFGKGLIQRQFDFEDGSAIRVTIARYHTPTGRVIQAPYENGHRDEYRNAFYERYERGESFSRDSISFPDSLKYNTLKKGRTVYGGGGIMPDVFVPRDTAYISDFYINVIGRGIMTMFSNSYIDTNRQALVGSYSDFAAFDKKFDVTGMFKAFLEFAGEKGVVPSEEDMKRSENELKLQLKALVARAIFGDNEYYRVMNSQDRDFIAAMETIMNLIGS